MHKRIKPPMAARPAVVWQEQCKKRIRVSTDQAAANAQMRKWKPIWEGTDKEAKPIRDNSKLNASDEAARNDNIVDLRAVCFEKLLCCGDIKLVPGGSVAAGAALCSRSVAVDAIFFLVVVVLFLRRLVVHLIGLECS